ncbi:5-formyltetrahydrofolate cyclo-ligase [Haloferula chungangensis]|uniref:5-formyltetrahydrofolate cyclo-ligase n=1 Tax=Haloferula chungangensis TaxID=1048331 RepID=A0ABW2L2K1_9BACT
MQETSPGPKAGKADWRRWLRRILASIDDPDAQSCRIRSQLVDHLGSHPPRCIATFSALPGEPALLDLIGTQPDHRWVLPRVIGDELLFHQIDHPEQLQTGAFGIAEPPADLPLVAIEEIDLFLCPGLGFDQRGMRLGRGKGFYDRTLTAAKATAQRIGIAYLEQIVPRIPCDPHDVPMDRIISSNGVITCENP